MIRPLLPSLAALLLSLTVTAQENVDHLALGKMWTFENPPLAYLEKEYGFKPDQKWLDSLRLDEPGEARGARGFPQQPDLETDDMTAQQQPGHECGHQRGEEADVRPCTLQQ